MQNLLPSDEQVFFDFGDGTTSDLEQTGHTYQQDGTYPVKLVGVKETCVYEKVISIPVYQLKVPNVITPDEFPENNKFVIQYGANKLSASSLTARVLIVNRWGKKVFESNNYQTIGMRVMWRAECIFMRYRFRARRPAKGGCM